jgi:MIP family channel proteins
MNRREWAPLTAETVGTFLFFFVGAGAVVLGDYPTKGAGGGGLVGVALAHGLVLGVLVSALGAVSGGHFNPAVTFGVWIAGRISARRAVTYVIAQLIGALIAGLALRAVFAEPVWGPSAVGTPALGPGIGIAPGIAIEAVLTAVLLFAVFGTAIDPRAPKIGGLAIGLAIAADILMGGPLTGAAMNPARWFGPAVASGHLDNWLVWIVGPLLGAAVAAAIYRGVLAEDADLARTPASPEPS